MEIYIIEEVHVDYGAKFEKDQMANKAYRYIILGNEKDLDMKAIEKIGTVKRLSTEDIFGY